MKLNSALGLLAVVIWTSCAHAQSTVAEATDKGGKFLAKDEVVALLGRDMQYRTKVNSPQYGIVTLTFRIADDGKVRGSASTFQGNAPISGTASVDEEGRLCMAVAAMSGSGQGCSYVLKLDSGFFSAESREPGAAVQKSFLGGS